MGVTYPDSRTVPRQQDCKVGEKGRPGVFMERIWLGSISVRDGTSVQEPGLHHTLVSVRA